MFERRAVDSSQELNGCAVEIVLDDGTREAGRLLLPISRTLPEVLNGSATFLEFDPYDGERRLIAKSALRSVRPIAPPRSASLAGRLRDMDNFDPHMVLGVRRDASWEDVRNAYRERSRVYHPDRFASTDLPEEVRGYLESMARRINAAYHALEVPHVAAKENRGQRSEPIFTSAPR